MIHADIAGKNHVPEDVLTSNCLGLLKLLGGDNVLDFLKHAKNLQGEFLQLENYHHDPEVIFAFWPYLPSGGIPDATVSINRTNSPTFLIIVEVKHGAAQPDGQLSKYWLAVKNLYPGRSVVLYLTHHRVLPKQEIEQSLNEAGPDAQIFWLSWFDLYKWAEIKLSQDFAPVEMRILETLRDYLDTKEYRVFRRWNELTSEPVTLPCRRRYNHTIVVQSARRFIRNYIRAPIDLLSCHYNL